MPIGPLTGDPDDTLYVQPHGPVAIGEGSTVLKERADMLARIESLQMSSREQALLYGQALTELMELREEVARLRRQLPGP